MGECLFPFIITHETPDLSSGIPRRGRNAGALQPHASHDPPPTSVSFFVPTKLFHNSFFLPQISGPLVSVSLYFGWLLLICDPNCQGLPSVDSLGRHLSFLWWHLWKREGAECGQVNAVLNLEQMTPCQAGAWGGGVNNFPELQQKKLYTNHPTQDQWHQLHCESWEIA